MIPRHALSRAVAARSLRRLGLAQPSSLRFAHSAAAASATHHTPSRTASSPQETNLRAIFDEPFSNASSSSASLLPSTGLFGHSSLQRPEDFIQLAHLTIRRAKAIVARITNAPNAGRDEMRVVVRNFDRLSDVLCGVIDMSELVRHAHPDPEWAEASHEAYEMLCSYMNVLNTHTGLYEVLSAVMADSSISADFSAEERAVAGIFLRDFERSGIDLPTDKRSEFVALSSEIITLGRHFLVDGAGSRGYVDIPILKLSESLANIPDSLPRDQRKAKDLLNTLGQRVSRLTGKVRVHGGTWDAHMLLKYCSDADIRRDIYVANYKPNASNVETLEELLRARSRVAQLVGSESFAEMTLSDKMAKTPENVNRFLRALIEHHRPLATAEIQRHLSLQNTYPSLLRQSSVLEAWDRDYYSTLLSSSSASSKSHPRSPSLTLGTVFQALSDLFSNAFGLRLRIVDLSPGEAWHPDVRKLEVFSVDSGEAIGWIFADLYARAGKHPGAAHYTVRCSRRLDRDDWAGDVRYDDPSDVHSSSSSSYESLASPEVRETGTTMRPRRVAGKEGIYQLPVAVLSCDFMKPSLKDGASMLSWHDVETLFHEMGHALHSMVGQTEFHDVAGTRCATDFVELPSILMEHFLASPAVQSLLFNRPITTPIQPSRSGGSSSSSPILDAHSQILLAMLDQAYHSPLASQPSFSSTQTFAELHNKEGVIPYAPGTAWHLQFSHLYGYGATYYSYLFDQAIASHVFKRVFAEAPMDRERGERYKNEVLKWGGGRDPWIMVGRLLGDSELEAGDARAMEKVGQWGIDAHTSLEQ